MICYVNLENQFRLKKKNQFISYDNGCKINLVSTPKWNITNGKAKLYTILHVK